MPWWWAWGTFSHPEGQCLFVVRECSLANVTNGNKDDSLETATAMVARREEVNFILSISRLIGCRVVARKQRGGRAGGKEFVLVGMEVATSRIATKQHVDLSSESVES